MPSAGWQDPPDETQSLDSSGGSTGLRRGRCGGGDEPSDVAQQGEAIFEANCAGCHGQDAVGTDQGPPLVHEVYEPSHHPDESFRNAVQQGVQPHHWEFGPMPPVPGVQGEDIDAVIAYVRSLQREAGIQ